MKDRGIRYLSTIYDELGKGKIEERFIREKPRRWHMHGYFDGETCVINPASATLDTLVHELFHRRFPKWSEAYVRARTTELLAHMTPDEQQKLFDAYCKQRKQKRTLTIDKAPKDKK